MTDRNHQEEIDAARDAFSRELELYRVGTEIVNASNRDVFKPVNPPQVKATLYLGGTTKDGVIVQKSDVDAFLKCNVPFSGFSFEMINGAWQGEFETTCRVTIFGDDSAAFRHECRTIAERYNDQFDQECVLVAFERAEYNLVSWPQGKRYTP